MNPLFAAPPLTVRMGSGSSRCPYLRRVCSEHSGGINWMSLSPDRRHLLTCSEDGTARLWTTSDHQCCMVFQGHESYITYCHLENEHAFTCSADHTIRRWDVRTGQCTDIYRGHTSIINRLLVAGNYLFSGSYDRTARCWSLDKGKQLQQFRGHRNCVLALAYFSSGDVLGESESDSEQNKDLLLTGSTDSCIKLWVVSSGRCYQTLRGHSGAILCLALDTSDKALYSGSTDHTIQKWNIVTGQLIKVFQEHQGSVICLEVVNRHLFSGSADRTVKCWLTESGECIRTYKAHRHTVSAVKYHDGILFTGSGDACAKAFDTKSGVLQRTFRGHAFIINCIQIHNKLLYTASHDGTLRIWDLHNLFQQDKEHLKRFQDAKDKNSPKSSQSRLCNNKIGCECDSRTLCKRTGNSAEQVTGRRGRSELL